MTHRSYRRRLMVAIATCFAALGCKAETVHRFDNMCLSFSSDEVSYFTDSPDGAAIPAARIGSPLLAIPDSFVAIGESSSGDLGLSISYRKISDVHRRGVSRRSVMLRRGCELVPEVTGLSRLVRPGGLATEPRLCRPSIAHERYIPTVATEETASVRVTCADNPAIVRCRMTTVLKNNWEANVSIKKTDLEHWEPVSRAASDFFFQYLTDCGGG